MRRRRLRLAGMRGCRGGAEGVLRGVLRGVQMGVQRGILREVLRGVLRRVLRGVAEGVAEGLMLRVMRGDEGGNYKVISRLLTEGYMMLRGYG